MAGLKLAQRSPDVAVVAESSKSPLREDYQTLIIIIIIIIAGRENQSEGVA